MSTRRTILLLVLVLLSAALLLWDAESRSLLRAVVTGVPPEPLAAQIDPLVDLDAADMLGFELHFGEHVFRADKRGETWEPPGAARAIAHFLTNLRGVGVVGTIAVAERDLADFGLAAAERTLILHWSGPEPWTQTVEIGNTNPPGTAVYTRLDGRGPVRLAGSVLVWEFDRLLERVERSERRGD